MILVNIVGDNGILHDGSAWPLAELELAGEVDVLCGYEQGRHGVVVARDVQVSSPGQALVLLRDEHGLFAVHKSDISSK